MPKLVAEPDIAADRRRLFAAATVGALVAMQTIVVVVGGGVPTARSLAAMLVGVALAAVVIQLSATRLMGPVKTSGGRAAADDASLRPAETDAPRQAASSPASAHAVPQPAVGLPPQQILVVEDTAINQDLLRHILEAGGHHVDIVGNGAEAIMAVLDMSYDIVLMDLQMPHVDGVSATKAIRRLPPPFRDVPIVGITADAPAEEMQDAKAAGMIELIQKPFSAAQVFATLARVLGAETAAAPEDHATLTKLAGLIGETKVRALLASLARSLLRQFDVPASEDGRTLARRQAHAAIAGAGMLGFTDFASACRALETAPDDDSFAPRLAAVRRQAEAVAAAAHDLSRRDAPLAARTRRASGTTAAQLVSS